MFDVVGGSIATAIMRSHSILGQMLTHDEVHALGARPERCIRVYEINRDFFADIVVTAVAFSAGIALEKI
jgi:hypothetical protein